MDHFKAEISELLRSISPLSPIALNAILELIEIKSYKKGEVFQEFQEKAINIAFLAQGSMIVRRNEENGKEKVIYFNFPEKTPFVGVLESLIQESNSNVEIKSLEDSIICQIKYKSLISLYSKFHEIETLGRKILEKHYLIALEQGRFRQSSIGIEKLMILNSKFPEVFAICEKKDIASYLGMTPTSYSRLIKDNKIT